MNEKENTDKRKKFNTNQIYAKNKFAVFFCFESAGLHVLNVLNFITWKIIMNERYISFHKEYNGLCIISIQMKGQQKNEANTICNSI